MNIPGILGGIGDRWYRSRSVVCPSIGYVCISSITLVHPAKAVERNEMPFGRDIRVVTGNTVLNKGSSPTPREGETWGWGWNPQSGAK